MLLYCMSDTVSIARNRQKDTMTVGPSGVPLQGFSCWLYAAPLHTCSSFRRWPRSDRGRSLGSVPTAS